MKAAGARTTRKRTSINPKDEKMKDNLQNIADLIGALAEDIEEIKKILAAKDAPDKDGAVKRLASDLEPVIRFFGGSTPENISDIFRSKETIEAYKNHWAVK